MIEDFSIEENRSKNTEEKARKKFDNKLFKYLRVFSRDELIAVRRFIISPYYNESQVVIDLFQYVRRFHKGGYTSHRLVNEVVFSHLFPDEPYNHQKLINLYSDLAVLLEKYLAVKELESEQMTKHKVLIDAYGKRRQFDFFEKEIGKGIKLVNKEKRHNNQYYKNKILLNSVMYEYPSDDQFKKNRERLPDLLKDLNEYYYLMKLRYTVYYLNDAHVLTTLEDKENLLRELSDIDEAIDCTEHPLLDFYRTLLRLMTKIFDLRDFELARDLFGKNVNLFEQEERKGAYTILLNIVTRAYNNRFVSIKRVFLIQSLGIEHKLLTKEDYLSDVTFLNIVLTGCAAREFTRLETLITSCEEYLSEKIKTDSIMLGRAYVKYYTNEYKNSLMILDNVCKSTTTIDLRGRILRVRNYMELLQQNSNEEDYYEAITYHADLCIKFLKRERNISQNTKSRNDVFLRILKQIAITARNQKIFLTDSQKKNEMTRIAKIRNRINNNNVASKQWLLEQLNLCSH